MAKPFFRNPEVFNNGVDVFIKGVGIRVDKIYQDIIWDIFNRILNQTPQFSGRAVANWNIGVGGPDYDFDPTAGDDIPMSDEIYRIDAHQRGDRRWIQKAQRRNKPKLALITRGKKVYINNGVMGDDGSPGGASHYGTTLYLDKLQEPGYWLDHLRAVNKPYETAQESVIIMVERVGRLRGETLKAGGNSLADYQ